MMNNNIYFSAVEDEYVRSLPVMGFPEIINIIDRPMGFEKIKHALIFYMNRGIWVLNIIV